MDEFIAKKQKNQKILTKHFVKFFQEQEGIFNTDEIKSVCSHVIPDENPVSPYVNYPGEITYFRAFLYALTCQSNSFDISNKHFLKGVSKFGIDSPFPCIAKKIYLYGNEINLAEIIKEKVSSFEDAQQVVMNHQTNVVGSNIVIRPPPAKSVVVGIQNMKMLDAKKAQKSNQRQTPKAKQSSIKFGTESLQQKDSSSSVLGKYQLRIFINIVFSNSKCRRITSKECKSCSSKLWYM